MADAMLDLDAARERRAERFVASSRELRGEMTRLCGDLERAVERLEEARDALKRARVGIEASRVVMERLRRCTGNAPPEERPRLRLVHA